MCKSANGGVPHEHSHSHGHEHHAHATHHPHATEDQLFPDHHAYPQSAGTFAAKRPTRRDFFRTLMGGALVGASVMELAYHRAAWARAASAAGDARLFDLQKAADGVFFAHARVQAMINCNAAIFVRSRDVVVVDAHSKPSAAAALLAQIQREITDKPVRYVINTHFHWDHTQGNPAYAQTGQKVDFIASSATRQLMSDLAEKRMKESVDSAPGEIEKLRKRSEKSDSLQEKAWCADQIRQMEAYLAEMKNYTLELPTITFDRSHVLADAAYELQLGFYGQAHTAGDVFVYCPARKALATGDASHCWLPNIGDGYPRRWPGTIDEVAKLDFTRVLGGHGPMQQNRTVMMSQRNYIEELTERVESAKKQGQTLAEMKQRITIASLRSMQSNGYAEFVGRTSGEENPHWGPLPPLQDGVNENTQQVLQNLDKA